MNLKCKINNKEYDIVNGAVFSEEYNETLDSGSIIITGVERDVDLRPFDDVFIYDADSEFNGYTSRKSDFLEVHTKSGINYIDFDKAELLNIYKNRTIEQKWLLLQYYDNYNRLQEGYCDLRYTSATDDFEIGLIENGVVNTWYQLNQMANHYSWSLTGFTTSQRAYFNQFMFKVQAINIEMPTFYKHLLIDTFTEERLNPIENLFKYKITLFSETKKLERIQLPNVSITQPLDISLRKSVADYIKQYVELYSPTIKVATSKDTFIYQNKYEVDGSIDTIFSNAYCPDFSLDNPSLRTLLNQLFLVKDRIPYVKDDVIYALDITERKGNFSLSKLNSITGSRSSENHSTSLKRNYKEALSSFSTARKVEYIGFRNSDSALMTLGNMRVETKFPIYKINKIYLCYYKKAQIWTGVGENAYYTGEDKVFLCKQDITQLVKLDEEEATLSKDWNEFTNQRPNSIEDMAQYKLCTVSYSRGSNKIEGWGTSYEYPMGWWGVTTITKTYIENIFNVLDEIYPYGIYKIGYLSRQLEPNQFITVDASTPRLNHIVTPIPTTDGAKRLKSFFFMVDYEAFYNGTTFTSKDNEDKDDIVTNDNPSASLTLLEKDGLFQKEKANRFGNMAYTYYGTYDELSELQELGSVDNSLDDDVIIYHREYQIYENYIRASYFGSKDYVLKNYFTSVYAKHRPFNLLPYSQSVIRAENRKMYLMLSKGKAYYENINDVHNALPPMKFVDFASYMQVLLSFVVSNPKPDTIDRFIYPNKINYGYVTYDGKMYANDINIFTNGYSLCMNISMWDNISMGKYIEQFNPQMNTPQTITENVADDLTGSVQSYYPIIDNVKTGFTETLGFYFAHTPTETFYDMVLPYVTGLETIFYRDLNKLPLIADSTERTNIIGKEYTLHKDNKEIIDMTFQIEPYTNDNDVLFSEWLLKLCDLYGVYTKFSNIQIVTETQGYYASLDVYCGHVSFLSGEGEYRISHSYPMMCLKIDITRFNDLTEGQPISFHYNWGQSVYDAPQHFPFDWVIIGLDVTFTKLKTKAVGELVFEAHCVKTVKRGWLDAFPQQEAVDMDIRLVKISNLGGIDFSSDTQHYYFSNIRTIGTTDFIDAGFPSGDYVDDRVAIRLDTTQFTDANHVVEALELGTTSSVSKSYYKNMYIRLNDNALKKTLVYDEYRDTTLDFEFRNIEDFITIESEPSNSALAIQEKTYIKIDLTYVANTKKSIEFWYSDREDLHDYLNGTLHFVFGVNLTQKDFELGYVKIYASLLTKKDTRVFGTNNLAIGKIVNYEDEDNDKNYGEKQYYVLE